MCRILIKRFYCNYKRLLSDNRDLLSIRCYVISKETIRIIILLKSALRFFKGLFTVKKGLKPCLIVSENALSILNTRNI
jgi:hypothetical protein